MSTKFLCRRNFQVEEISCRVKIFMSRQKVFYVNEISMSMELSGHRIFPCREFSTTMNLAMST